MRSFSLFLKRLKMSLKKTTSWNAYATLSCFWGYCWSRSDLRAKRKRKPPDNGIYEVSLFLISPAPNRVNLREFGKPVEVEVFFKRRGDDKTVQHAVVELQKNGASSNAPKIVEEAFLDSNLNSPGQHHFKHTYTPSGYMFDYIYTYTSDSTGASDGPAISYFLLSRIRSPRTSRLQLT